MFSKFKKVLVSLALASSLALAPMNVSADDNPTLTNANQSAQFPVYLTGTASVTPEYVIEVSPTITIDLDNIKTKASNLNDSTEAEGGVYLKLKEADDFGDKSLQVTPNFSVSDGTTVIYFSAEDANAQPVAGKETMTLSELGVDSALLSFGSNVATFAEDDANSNTIKPIAATVNPTKAAAIRKNIPDQITDTLDANKKSSEPPKIAADQQIGTITFTCALVKSE